MKKVFFILILIFSEIGFAQSESKMLTIPNSDEIVYLTTQVSVVPSFVGGKNALDIFIKRNFKQPKVKGGLKGEVLVSFIVEKDGTLSEIGILSDAGYATGEEAIRVMKASPKWVSGILNGSQVRVQYMISIPVIFK